MKVEVIILLSAITLFQTISLYIFCDHILTFKVRVACLKLMLYIASITQLVWLKEKDVVLVEGRVCCFGCTKKDTNFTSDLLDI